MIRVLRRLISTNKYVLLGLFFGIYMQYVFYKTEFGCNSEISISDAISEVHTVKKLVVKPPVPNITKSNINDPNKKKKKLIRPRYYSTELGIREKLFIGIFTSEDKVNTQAIHINRTIAHLVDKIKFFITAQYKLKSKFNLTGLVGFTDTRFKYRPFQIFKYIADNFGQEYDYYLLANDLTYLNIHRVKEIVNDISVSMDVYLGTKEIDSSFCNLDAGLIISNSVLKAVREKLDWCVLNAVSDSHSENIGRCIYNSIGLNCQEFVQTQKLASFRLRHFDLDKSLYNLSHRKDFTVAATVFPILQEKDFYRLNTYFIEQRLKELEEKEKILADSLTDSWPPGHKPKVKPATRFDMPRQTFFNTTHVFFPDDFTNIRKQTRFELMDLENILEKVLFEAKNNNKDLNFRQFLSGFKSFDASRGIDYVLDLEFTDKSSEIVTRRFEVCKPLSKVEFIPVPYVTENRKITVFLVIQEHEIKEAKIFLNNFLNIMNDKKDKNFLMLILFYQNNSNSKGKTDVFHEIKNFVKKTSSLFKEELKVAWVSIRLPNFDSYMTNSEVRSLNFAAVDLALKKVGVDNLILILNSYCNVTKDFFNRVRMNTIESFQVFSPVPFRQYNPEISEYPKLEINKNAGHFDREEYRFISFYGRDYVKARKRYQHKMPIIRNDNDILDVIKVPYNNVGNLFEMFVETLPDFRHMRAPDMSFLVRYHDELDQSRRNKFIAGQSQLAKYLLKEKSRIPILN